jgi:hypothetical protein
MNVENLLAKFAAGTLTMDERAELYQLGPHEAAKVARLLEAEKCDPYGALFALGRSWAIEHRPLVERYLDGSKGVMLARLALFVLCENWNLSADYRGVITEFVAGVPWDDENDVRILAIDIAGSLLKTEPDLRLLRLVVEMYNDRSEPPPQLMRAAAYLALAKAAGRTYNEMPSDGLDFEVDEQQDPVVRAYIENAQRLLDASG